MTNELTLKTEIQINGSISKVWDALTKPELVKQYFFGTELSTDWKIGSPIFYRGVWDGKPYEDKGNVLGIETEKFIHYNYWSSFSGTEDILSNYHNIIYQLSHLDGVTTLHISQDGIANQETLEHSAKNWDLVLAGLKTLVEN